LSNRSTTVIFEKGIMLQRSGKTWKCMTSNKSLSLSLGELSTKLRVRPIIKSDAEANATILLSTSGHKSLNRRVEYIGSGLVPVQFFPYDPLRVEYTLREVVYHCEHLARNCSHLCVKSLKHALYGEIQGDTLIAIRDWVDPCYFEFESWLTCLIRAYELLRFHISKAMVLSTPRSYESLISQIHLKVPVFEATISNYRVDIINGS